MPVEFLLGEAIVIANDTIYDTNIMTDTLPQIRTTSTSTVSFLGAATISLSSTSSPVDKKVIATLRETAGYAKVKTSPISIIHFQPKG